MLVVLWLLASPLEELRLVLLWLLGVLIELLLCQLLEVLGLLMLLPVELSELLVWLL